MSNYKLPNFIYPVYSVNFNPNSKKLYSQHALLDEEALEEKLLSNEFVILDFNRDHSNFVFGKTSLLDAYEHFYSKGYTNIIYLSSEQIDKEHVYFFPNWLYCKSKEYEDIDIHLSSTRQYKLSSLNRFPSPHRIYFYYKLLHRPYYKECLTSFLGLVNPYNNYADVGEYNPIYKEVPEYVKQFYEKNRYQKKLDSDLVAWPNDHNPNNPAYINSYMNVITESTYYYSFFTEKTAKALVAEQLFMLVGGCNSIRNLRSLGFECFNLLNDEYDKIPDMLERVNCIMNIIDNVYANIEELYYQFTEERVYNRIYFLSAEFRNKCLKPVRDLLK